MFFAGGRAGGRADGRKDMAKLIVALSSSTLCLHSEFMCCVWISGQTANIYLCSIKRLVFITEIVCVYAAVQAKYV
jgi:aminoglycoside N3'-acetyltransferase